MSAKTANKLMISRNKKDFIPLDYTRLRKAALSIAALNHPIRKQIIKLLQEGARITVTEIFKKIKTEQSVASQHLAILRRADILNTQRNGKYIFYYINEHRLAETHDLINELAGNR